MSNVKDFFPTVAGGYEHTPMLHVQDQKTTGTAGGTSVAGYNQRDLNTVIKNEISGASLSSNLITLPAGEYYVEGMGVCRADAASSVKTFIRDNSDDSVILVGANGRLQASLEQAVPMVSGRFTLSTTTVIKLDTYHTDALATSGFGVNSSIAPYEVFADLKIWKLDAIKTQPVVRDDKLYPLPGSSFVTGNIQGLDYSMNSGSPTDTIDITAGICMDSLNTTVLTLASDTTAQISSPVLNTIYNVFMCDTGGTVDIQFDTDVDGATLLAGTVDYLRWIGFVTTDSSADILSFRMNGKDFTFTTILTDTSILSVGTTPTLVDISSLSPVSRLYSYSLLFRPSSGGAQGILQYSTSSADAVWKEALSSSVDLRGPDGLVAGVSLYAYASTGTVSVYLSAMKLRR